MQKEKSNKKDSLQFSVIVPTYNDWANLMLCLSALEKQKIDKDQYEVIVVNNNKIVPEDIVLPQWIRLLHESLPGSYTARNKGAEVAAGEILAFTDSDCIPDPNWLKNALNHFEGSVCDLIGGKVNIFSNGNSDKYGYIYDRLTAFKQDRNVSVGRSVTANLFVKKSVFDKLGGFDSAMKSGGDWDFTQRCTEMKHTMIYGKDVLVLHPARNLRMIFKKQYRLTCWGALNVKSRYGHSHFRILISHLLRGLNFERKNLSEELKISEKIVVFFIYIMKYLYRIFIHIGLFFRLIYPNKIRE